MWFAVPSAKGYERMVGGAQLLNEQMYFYSYVMHSSADISVFLSTGCDFRALLILPWVPEGIVFHFGVRFQGLLFICGS